MNQLLQRVPIFAGLKESALTWLAEKAEQSAVPAGTIVVREGEPGNRFYLIGSGSVRVCKYFAEPGEVVLAELKASDFFGEMCILETLPRSATVQTASETTLFSLSSVTFYHFFKQMPDQYCILLLNIARDLSRRLRHLDEVFAARH